MQNFETKRLLRLATLAFSSVLPLACSQPQQPKKPEGLDKIVIGIQPNEGQRDFSDFRKDLEARIGKTVEIVVSKDYSDLVEKFKSDKVDFAFFTALTFLQAQREAKPKVLLKKVYGKSEFYYSCILTLADGKLKKPADLKGKKLGFVDPKSTSGYLYPRQILRQHGFDAGPGADASKSTVLQAEFLGTHDKAVQALIDGKVDAIGVWMDEPSMHSGAWTDIARGKKFHVVASSEAIPNDAFVVREKFYEEHPMVVFQVMESFISMSESPGKPLKKAFDIEKLATATNRHYDSVKTIEDIVLLGGAK